MWDMIAILALRTRIYARIYTRIERTTTKILRIELTGFVRERIGVTEMILSRRSMHVTVRRAQSKVVDCCPSSTVLLTRLLYDGLTTVTSSNTHEFILVVLTLLLEVGTPCGVTGKNSSISPRSRGPVRIVISFLIAFVTISFTVFFLTSVSSGVLVSQVSVSQK